MKNKKGRHEIKHYINYADFIELKSRLPYVLKLDENAIDGDAYKIRSLYFDNYRDKALREKIDGINIREKFRLRLYNGDSSFIKLERKSKENGICFKDSAKISFDDCKRILDGEYEVLKERGHPLLLELYAKINSQLLRPKNIVDYKREAYCFSAGNTRITLDYDIRYSHDIKSFLKTELMGVPIPNTIILEVKYNNFLPEIVRGMVSLASRQQSSFSKYAATRII